MAPDTDQARAEVTALLQGTRKIDPNDVADHGILSGKTAIVTGGGSGIGRGIVIALRDRGAHVAILDITCAEEGGLLQHQAIKFFPCDVTDWDSLQSAFAHVTKWSQHQLDIVVLSAGVRSHNIKDLILNASGRPVKPPSTVLDVNLLGTYYSAYLALWHFTHLKSGKQAGWNPQLLFLGSLAGYVEQPLSTDYCASKHGVRGLWKSMRAHGKQFGGCQMNLLAPTLINTRLGSTKTRAGGFQELFKLGEVEDVVAGALTCLTNDDIDGRALCCVRGEEGSPGCNNFDLCDNILDLNAGEIVLENLTNGVVASLEP